MYSWCAFLTNILKISTLDQLKSLQQMAFYQHSRDNSCICFFSWLETSYICIMHTTIDELDITEIGFGFKHSATFKTDITWKCWGEITIYVYSYACIIYCIPIAFKEIELKCRLCHLNGIKTTSAILLFKRLQLLARDGRVFFVFSCLVSSLWLKCSEVPCVNVRHLQTQKFMSIY